MLDNDYQQALKQVLRGRAVFRFLSVFSAAARKTYMHLDTLVKAMLVQQQYAARQKEWHDVPHDYSGGAYKKMRDVHYAKYQVVFDAESIAEILTTAVGCILPSAVMQKYQLVILRHVGVACYLAAPANEESAETANSLRACRIMSDLINWVVRLDGIDKDAIFDHLETAKSDLLDFAATPIGRVSQAITQGVQAGEIIPAMG